MYRYCYLFSTDDMNMPAKEIYGAQPPIELLRQWIEHHHWYDKDTSRLKIVDVLFMSAMGPPGGGKNDITGMFKKLPVTLYIRGFNEESSLNCIRFSLIKKMFEILGRFTRHLNVISIDCFDDETMTKIFSSITDWHFSKGFDASFYR